MVLGTASGRDVVHKLCVYGCFAWAYVHPLHGACSVSAELRRGHWSPPPTPEWKLEGVDMWVLGIEPESLARVAIALHH